jgi:hypothetical protein
MARGKSFHAASAAAAASSSSVGSSPSAPPPNPPGAPSPLHPTSLDPSPVNPTAEAIVDVYGPSIPGEHKWLGAAVAADGCIYGVPSHNRRVVRVDPSRGSVTELGTDDVLTDRAFKYLRGIRTRAGTVLGIPAWADSVLEISPATGAVRVIGKLSTKDSPVNKNWKWMWHGAAEGEDGIIYGIPSNADAVLRVDPVTREVTTFGAEDIPPGRNKWYGGIRGPDGCVYGVPYTANHVLKIDPKKQSVEMLGDFSDVPGGWRWHGGVRSGDFIYAFPSHAPRVLKIDCLAGRAYEIGPSFEGRYKWGGGAVDLDGNVYGMPSDTDGVLRIRVATDEVDVIGRGKLPAIKNKWQGGVLSPCGAIFAIPADASSVLKIEPSTGEVSLVGDLGDAPDKWQGGFLGSDGIIYGIPENHDRILRVVPAGRGVELEEGGEENAGAKKTRAPGMAAVVRAAAASGAAAVGPAEEAAGAPKAKEGAKEGAPEAAGAPKAKEGAGAPKAKHFVPEDARDPAALGSLDKAALAVAASVAVAGVGLAAFAALRTRPA